MGQSPVSGPSQARLRPVSGLCQVRLGPSQARLRAPSSALWRGIGLSAHGDDAERYSLGIGHTYLANCGFEDRVPCARQKVARPASQVLRCLTTMRCVVATAL